jgi:hypothetical protein
MEEQVEDSRTAMCKQELIIKFETWRKFIVNVVSVNVLASVGQFMRERLSTLR